MSDPALLDDPVWHALTGPHRRFAVAGEHPGRACRYRVDVAPFGAVRDTADPHAWRELADLCGPGGRAALEAPEVIETPTGWATGTVFELAQMIAPANGLTIGDTTETVVPLDKRNAAEMIALAELTRPGPFLTSTVELGGYLGVRREGRLVAMAGRRMHLPGWIEISAVCTHPDHRGQGLSRLLMATVETAIRRTGHRAFLHVLHENTRAISIYRGLGFTTRADMTMTVAHPEG
ncbi:GNAT family N-acetyltransferase [Candidatus Mycobacterium wuenschmannii]|uniref:GNAT family N-acetyltransferase n=1 Tax=Candidatus Mycobacterium wuenschmannii TaxID=3027808 RepID=A0ABY8VZZ1_9MYCO|nr:GNAT family N-acetyltransferase [Candidatus Mycobacterium wuenschmannii]WIM88461.1 GNAT family N-acetyltransferase [Candidatus Mycobacterium wuenschmannii]